LKAACLNPIGHYGLDVGQLRVGDPADFIVVDDLTSFRVRQTYVRGKKVADNGKSLIEPVSINTPNQFKARSVSAADFKVQIKPGKLRVMVAHDGQLITTENACAPKVESGNAVADASRDLLKIAVINRYNDAKPSLAFIQGFGLQVGAIASSVAHDSHNIIVVGCDDEAMARAVNAIMQQQGGISAANGETVRLLPLPVAGIMSDQDGLRVASKYQELDHEAKQMGSTLGAPFMTLSFMALLVIPSLKLSDKGLFDGNRFEFVPLFTGTE
jgi:adenine deaminase